MSINDYYVGYDIQSFVKAHPQLGNIHGAIRLSCGFHQCREGE